MKKLSHITLVLLISLFTGSVAFASFPYTKEQKTSTETQVLTETVIEKEAIQPLVTLLNYSSHLFYGSFWVGLRLTGGTEKNLLSGILYLSFVFGVALPVR